MPCPHQVSGIASTISTANFFADKSLFLGVHVNLDMHVNGLHSICISGVCTCACLLRFKAHLVHHVAGPCTTSASNQIFCFAFSLLTIVRQDEHRPNK